MNAAKIVPDNKQSNGSFQHREFLTDGISLSGKPSYVHMDRQIRPFGVRC
jgi:hypothetical protein